MKDWTYQEAMRAKAERAAAAIVFAAESAWDFAHRDGGNGIQRPAIVRDLSGQLRPLIGSRVTYGTFVEFGESPHADEVGGQ